MKVFRKVWDIVTMIFVVAVVLLAIALVGVRLLGFKPYAILSPSMTPEYGVGDLVYVKKTAFENIKEKDVITFVAGDDLTVVTHRVDEIDRDNESIYTKGDANASRDASPVLYKNVVGVVKFSLPKLGYVSNYFMSDSGKYVGIAVIFGMLLFIVISELLKPDKKKADKTKEVTDNKTSG